MSQALNNLKKLIIESIEEEISIEERLNLFLEKNTPTNPSKWSYYKSQAKKKFDVYPSAYANAWAAKKYKAAGGGWKKEQIGEASMTGNLDGGEGPPQTPYAFQSKKKRAQDKKKEDDISTNSTGFTKVNEATKQEVNALKKFIRDFDKMQKQYWNISKIGDKELRNPKYNKHYETILKAQKSIVKLAREIQEKERVGEGLNEVTKQEVNALRNLVKGIGNLKKDFSKATNLGDKELRKRDYNKHYETLLKAEKAMVQLMQFFKTKQRLGEGLNEGRYHDWRNDESLTPKQKIGRSIREVRNSLNELNKTINMNLKLKNELQVDSRDYWKTTHKALSGISEKLVKLAGKVGNLK